MEPDMLPTLVMTMAQQHKCQELMCPSCNGELFEIPRRTVAEQQSDRRAAACQTCQLLFVWRRV